MQPLKQWLVRIPILTLLFLLVACSQQVDLTLWEGNEFSATILTSTLVGTEQQQSAEDVAQELDAQVSDIRSQPNITRAEWRRLDTNEDEFKAEVTIEGNDYAAIESLLEGDATVRPVVQNGEEAVDFTYVFSPTATYTLTLHSGEVLSTNGNQADDGTVQWNGGVMNAVVRPKSRASGNLPLLVGGVVVAVLVISAGLFAMRREGATPASTS